MVRLYILHILKNLRSKSLVVETAKKRLDATPIIPIKSGLSDRNDNASNRKRNGWTLLLSLKKTSGVHLSRSLVIGLMMLVIVAGSVRGADKVNSTYYSEAFLSTKSTKPVLSEPVFFRIAPVLAHKAPVFVKTPPVLVVTAPIFGKASPVFTRIAPVFVETALFFGKTPPVLVETSPIFGKTPPVFTRTTPVSAHIYAVIHRTTSRRTRTLLVQTVLPSILTSIIPELDKSVSIQTKIFLIRDRIPQITTRGSPDNRLTAQSGLTDNA